MDKDILTEEEIKEAYRSCKAGGFLRSLKGFEVEKTISQHTIDKLKRLGRLRDEPPADRAEDVKKILRKAESVEVLETGNKCIWAALSIKQIDDMTEEICNIFSDD